MSTKECNLNYGWKTKIDINCNNNKGLYYLEFRFNYELVNFFLESGYNYLNLFNTKNNRDKKNLIFSLYRKNDNFYVDKILNCKKDFLMINLYTFNIINNNRKTFLIKNDVDKFYLKIFNLNYKFILVNSNFTKKQINNMLYDIYNYYYDTKLVLINNNKDNLFFDCKDYLNNNKRELLKDLNDRILYLSTPILHFFSKILLKENI